MPGIRRDVDEEDRAFEQAPLHSFHHNYPTSVMWALARLWQSLVPVAPRLMRAISTAQETGSRAPVGPPPVEEPGALTAWLRAEAAGIGISTLGIADYDPRYTFADLAEEVAGDTVILRTVDLLSAGASPQPGQTRTHGATPFFAALHPLARHAYASCRIVALLPGAGVIAQQCFEALEIGLRRRLARLVPPRAPRQCPGLRPRPA